MFLPCYNEQKDIKDLIEAWLREKPVLVNEGFELHLVPIDDGSRDNTRQIIAGLAKEHSEITFLIHEVNKGLGGGVATGLTYFNDHAAAGDYALIMDADNTHEPKYAKEMLREAMGKNLDCVIASRYRKNSSVVGLAGGRVLLSFGARVYYTLVLGVKNVRDYTCGYRVYSYDIVQRAVEVYGDKLVENRGFTCMMEVLYKLYCIGAKFGEVPFELRYDYKQGESKMRVTKTMVESFKTAVRLRFSIKKSA